MRASKRKRKCIENGAMQERPVHQRNLCKTLIKEHTERLTKIQNAVLSHIWKRRTISTAEARRYINLIVDIQEQDSKQITQEIQQVADKLLRQMKVIIKENAEKFKSNPDKEPTDNFSDNSNILSTAELKSAYNTLSNIDVAVNTEDLSNNFKLDDINESIKLTKHFKNTGNQFDIKDSAFSRKRNILKKKNKPLTVKKIYYKPLRKRAISETLPKTKKLYSSYETADDYSAKDISKQLDLGNDARQDKTTTNQNNTDYTKDNSMNLRKANLKKLSITETIIQVINSNDESPDILDLRTNKGLNNECNLHSNAKVSNIKNINNESIVLGSNDETPNYLTANGMNKKLDLSNNDTNFTKDISMNLCTTNPKYSSITETVMQIIGSNDETPDIHVPRTNKNKINAGHNNEFHHYGNSKVSNINMNFTNDYTNKSVTKKNSIDNTKNNSSATPQFDSSEDPSQTQSLHGRAYSTILNGFREIYHSIETNETTTQNENMKTNEAKKNNETMNTQTNNVSRGFGANSKNITNSGMNLKHAEGNHVPYKKAGFTNKSQTVNTSILSNIVEPSKHTYTYIPIEHQNMTTQKYDNKDLQLQINTIMIVNKQFEGNSSLQNQRYAQQRNTSSTSGPLKNIDEPQKTLHIPQLPDSLNTIPDSQNTDININTTQSKYIVNQKISGKVTKNNATRKTSKNPRRKHNTVSTKKSQNREPQVNNCAIVESPTQNIKLNICENKILEDLKCTRKTPKNPRRKQNTVSTKHSQTNYVVTDPSTQSAKLNFGKKKIFENLAWVEKIRFVRSIEADEYLPIELSESFWKENATFPGLKNEDFYI